jgi:hypothetical protein
LGLTWSVGGAARSVGVAGASAGRRGNGAENWAGKFELDLSMVSIVHVYPRKYSRNSEKAD